MSKSFVAAVVAVLLGIGCEEGGSGATESTTRTHSSGGVTTAPPGHGGGRSIFGGEQSNAGGSGSLGFGGAGQAGEPTGDLTMANGFGSTGQRAPDAGTPGDGGMRPGGADGGLQAGGTDGGVTRDGGAADAGTAPAKRRR